MTVPERPTHILVVDDEEQIRRALRSILGSRGYSLEFAITAEEALLKAIDRHLGRSPNSGFPAANLNVPPFEQNASFAQSR